MNPSRRLRRIAEHSDPERAAELHAIANDVDRLERMLWGLDGAVNDGARAVVRELTKKLIAELRLSPPLGFSPTAVEP